MILEGFSSTKTFTVTMQCLSRLWLKVIPIPSTISGLRLSLPCPDPACIQELAGRAVREELGRVCKLTMDPRHSSIWLFRKAASELLCKHALVFIGGDPPVLSTLDNDTSRITR